MHLPIKKRGVGERRNAANADIGASGWSTVPTGTNSSASSSSTTLTGDCYDVFLSFRGVDTRKGFTDHLYYGLVDAGFRVFRDDDELRQGEEIGPNLFAAIKNSKILIPILSMNYGSSKWCLDELVEMMKCKNSNTGQVLLPIFYEVEPFHVRYQTGSFGDVFRTRESRSDPETMEKWKQALREVSGLKGQDAKGYEGKLVKSVIQEVSKLNEEFDFAPQEILVGIDSHVKKVMVDNDSSATLFIGIHGMGGVGKTTLAKAIFKKLSVQFNCRSFIEDVRESCEHNDGLKCLQSQLLSDILKREIRVRNKEDGITLISSKCTDKKVLIMLDDLDDVDQLKALAGNHNWFSSGSRILITTRDKSILDTAGVDYNYEHKEMDEIQSLIMFSRHAFGRNSPPSEFEELARKVVSTTGGLPLSLEVLGSYLRKKEPPEWTATIEKSEKIPHKKVQQKLRISYESLEFEQKQIFLDIACFFIGTDKRKASYMWDACRFFPEREIKVLSSMSLIKVGEKHELRMHDQLRDLGRRIVHEENQQEPQYRSRLWDSKEVLKVLQGNKGTEKIKAIYLSKGSSEDLGETTNQGGDMHINEQFENLTELRFLHMSGAHFSGDFKNSSKELRWLGWQNCPSTFEAKNFLAKELVVLDLSRSKISDKWRGWSSIMMAEELKFLDLTSCASLKGTFFLSAFKNLGVLVLQGCRKVEQIDSSIGEMKNLVCLDLTSCVNLKELPEEVGKLGALEQLLLKHTRIKELPDSIGDLQNLEILDISFSTIEKLPSAIGRLTKLRDLDASFCLGLKGKIPESIYNLSSLQCLNFFGCCKLQLLSELPSNLKHLRFTWQFGGLPALIHRTDLNETYNCLNCILEDVKKSELPIQLSECSQLIDVEESELPKSLYTPSKLEILEIQGYVSLQTLDVSQSNHLRSLCVVLCPKLEVRGLDKLKYLERLTITHASIERLDLQKLERLKILHIQSCQNLVEIQGLDGLEFLEVICIIGCRLIDRLDLSKFKGLKILNVEFYSNVSRIQGLDRLKFLEELCIENTSIERLNLGSLEGMKILYAENCKNLVEIQGLDRLKFLEELNISGCVSMKRLDLSRSKCMRILCATNCENLVEIEGLDEMRCLELLDISGCVSIERLYLPKSEVMKTLCAENCRNLVKLQDLDGLESLKELNISGCSSIERPEFPKSNDLMILDVENHEERYEPREGRSVNFRILIVLILVYFIISRMLMD